MNMNAARKTAVTVGACTLMAVLFVFLLEYFPQVMIWGAMTFLVAFFVKMIYDLYVTQEKFNNQD